MFNVSWFKITREVASELDKYETRGECYVEP